MKALHTGKGLKILHVIPSYYPAIQFGGPIQSVHLLNKTLAAQGTAIDVVTTNAGLEGDKTYSDKSELVVDGVRVKYFPYYGYVHYNFSPRLAGYLQKKVKEYDLVHITAVWNYPVWAAATACMKAGIPYIISPRGTIYPETIALKSTLFKKAYYQLFARRCLQNAAAIHYTANDEKDKVSQYLRLAPANFVIPNGIELSAFTSLNQIPSFGSFFPELAGKRYILFLSRINMKKGLDLLADAFARISLHFPDVLLVIAGPDNEGYGKEVRERLQANGISDKAFFPGMLSGDAKLAAYRDAEIFVLPSYSENFGMSVVEAMACSTPVVISDQVGIGSEIESRRAGVVVPTRSDRLALAINDLLVNDPERKTIQANGLQMVKELYSIESVAQAMKAQYERVVQATGQDFSSYTAIPIYK